MRTIWWSKQNWPSQQVPNMKTCPIKAQIWCSCTLNDQNLKCSLLPFQIFFSSDICLLRNSKLKLNYTHDVLLMLRSVFTNRKFDCLPHKFLGHATKALALMKGEDSYDLKPMSLKRSILEQMHNFLGVLPIVIIVDVNSITTFVNFMIPTSMCSNSNIAIEFVVGHE